MINVKHPEILDYLKNLSEHSILNFVGLIQLIESEQIPIIAHDFPTEYSGALGATNEVGIYLNFHRLTNFGQVDIFHVILHEIGHYLRVRKEGADNINKTIASYTTVTEMNDHLIYEERFAEKYATLTYYKLNSKLDSSQIRLNFKNVNFFNGGLSYAKFLLTELQNTGLTFFDYSRHALNIK
jgi:hypothetical protein